MGCQSSAARNQGASISKCENSYLEWRQSTVCPPAPPKLADVDDEAYAAERERSVQQVFDHLNAQAGNLEDLPIMYLMKPDADWSCFAHAQLERAKEINRLAGPRMQVVWFGTLEALGRFPRWPDDVGHVLDWEDVLKGWIERMDDKGKIDGKAIVVSFFSHRWERAHKDPSQAHPDSCDHKKCKALWNYGRMGSCSTFTLHTFDYYFWIDFAGVHQDCTLQKLAGIAKLPAYVTACSELVFYDSTTVDYPSRCWTRIERMLGYCYTYAPYFVYMNDFYPQVAPDTAELCRNQPDVYLEDSENAGHLCMILEDPEKGNLTSEADRPLIQLLCKHCKAATPFSSELRGLDQGRLNFGSSFCRVDTEHALMDLRKLQQMTDYMVQKLSTTKRPTLLDKEDKEEEPFISI